MAKYIRFSDEFLDRIRSETDLPALIERDVKLKRAGQNFVACCPFHDEKTPSFQVSPDKNTYRCWGCGARGDAIEWMRNKHHLSFHDAVVHLAGVGGIPLPVEERDSDEDKAQRKRLAVLYQALKEAARVFSRGLAKSPAARSYLDQKRGLSAETIERFGLGVVAKGVVELLGGSTTRDALLGSGLAAQREDGEIYDRFRHRIMFPIHNESGNLVGFAGRSMIEKPDKTPKYVNCPETEIFHKGRELYALHLAKPAIRAGRVAVIVEGYFDVISLHQAGDERVVAPMGTALTNLQVRRLLVHADTIVFAFDGDAAGRKAALGAAAVLLDEMKDGKTARFLFLPEGEDPDSFVRAHGLEAWHAATEQAAPLSAFLTDYVTHGLDRDVPESQVKAAEKAKAILARIQHAELFGRAMKAKFEEVVGVSLD
ncbi:DNA primase (plasmid) [Xanthomonas campestris pv. olitorii]|nr:DNA primase [Xanthomonas campestris pv. olitorii]